MPLFGRVLSAYVKYHTLFMREDSQNRDFSRPDRGYVMLLGFQEKSVRLDTVAAEVET